MIETNDTLKILVVDDEPDLELLMRQKYRREIRENKVIFDFAENGEAALDKLRQTSDFDIVLTDINMPRMDGLTLLGHLPQISPIIKAIIVSAYGDMENIRTAMNRGAFDFITKPINFDDLRQTVEKTYRFVAQQRATLKAISENDILKMYVDKDVIRFMSSVGINQNLLAGETIKATVAFIDICGFTALSEEFPADEVVKLLNSYFDTVVPVIEAHRGHVDKFIGDCVMAVFRGPDHASDALHCALEISKVISGAASHLPREFRPDISIGINTGEMISGNIGSASLKRFDFTVIGDVVNTAQRLQECGKPGQIIVSEALKQHEQSKGTFNFEPLGAIILKNKNQKQNIFHLKSKTT